MNQWKSLVRDLFNTCYFLFLILQSFKRSRDIFQELLIFKKSILHYQDYLLNALNHVAECRVRRDYVRVALYRRRFGLMKSKVHRNQLLFFGDFCL